MKVNEIVREIMKKSDIRPATVCGRMGLKSNTWANRMKREQWWTDNLVDTARALDYKVILVPRETRIPENGYEVE